jgi:hypothetical protein
MLFAKVNLKVGEFVRVYLPSAPSQLKLFVQENLNDGPIDRVYLRRSPSQLTLCA